MEAPDNARVYAATEGLTTARESLVQTADGEKVVYLGTDVKEVTREWKWRSHEDNRTNDGRRSNRRARRGVGSGEWVSVERESDSVESNVRNAGVGVYSGDAVAFVDGGAQANAIAALNRKTSERFEAKQGATVVVNNNNNGSNDSPDVQPPPETLGFRKVGLATTAFYCSGGVRAWTLCALVLVMLMCVRMDTM